MFPLPSWGKYLGIAVLAAGIFAGGYVLSSKVSAGKVAKADARTAQLERDVAQVTAEALSQRMADVARFEANNAKARAEYEQAISGLDARSRDMAGRLFAATAAAAGCRKVPAPAGRSQLPLASEITAGMGRVREAFGRARSASLEDAARLNALSAQLQPQLTPAP